MSAIVNYRERRDELSKSLVNAQKRMDAVIPMRARELGLSGVRLSAIVLDATLRDPSLLACDLSSIVRCVVTSAELGLEIGSPLGEAYIVPYKGRATFIAGYKGLVKLALQTPSLAKLESRVVYADDEFAYRYGTDPQIEHQPGKGSRVDPKLVVAAYAIAFQRDGNTQFEVMERDELDRIRAKSRAAKGPWISDTIAMYRKCPIRKLANYIELSPLARDAFAKDEEPKYVMPAAVVEAGDVAVEAEAEAIDAELVDEPQPATKENDS